MLLGVVVADIATGSELSFSFFYVVPLALVMWRFGGRTWVFGSLIAAAIWFAVDAFTRPDGALIIPMWNAVIRAAFFLSITGLLLNLQAALRRETDLANFDALTGLPNRSALVVAAERELARTQRSGDSITFVMIDLDGLKKINDTAGHAAGDEAIRAAGHVMSTAIRRSDMAARIGGDEFALMLLGPESRVVLDRILDRMAEQSFQDTNSIVPSALRRLSICPSRQRWTPQTKPSTKQKEPARDRWSSRGAELPRRPVHQRWSETASSLERSDSNPSPACEASVGGTLTPGRRGRGGSVRSQAATRSSDAVSKQISQVMSGHAAASRSSPSSTNQSIMSVSAVHSMDSLYRPGVTQTSASPRNVCLNALARPEGALSDGAVGEATMDEVERVLFHGSAVQVGTFRCPPRHERFPGGRVETNLVAFPWCAVMIEREGSAPVVADPGIAVLHNPPSRPRSGLGALRRRRVDDSQCSGPGTTRRTSDWSSRRALATRTLTASETCSSVTTTLAASSDSEVARHTSSLVPRDASSSCGDLRSRVMVSVRGEELVMSTATGMVIASLRRTRRVTELRSPARPTCTRVPTDQRCEPSQRRSRTTTSEWMPSDWAMWMETD